MEPLVHVSLSDAGESIKPTQICSGDHCVYQSQADSYCKIGKTMKGGLTEMLQIEITLKKKKGWTSITAKIMASLDFSTAEDIIFTDFQCK